MVDGPNEDDRPSGFLAVVDLGDGPSANEYIGPIAPEPSGTMFGGQLMAQAIAAAYRTVDDDRHVNSVHALFLRAGVVDQTTDWRVERVREGRSFATRSISGSQGGKEIFRLLASFHVPEDGLEYQPAMDFDIDALPSPEDVPMSYVDFCRAHPDTDATDWSGEDRPMDIRYIDPPHPVAGPPDFTPQQTWMRLTGAVPDVPELHYAGLAYLADATLVDHALLPHGYRWQDGRLTGTSLDHAMWFRRQPKADDWVLYDQRVESTGGARGLVVGRFYNTAGELLASCTQEGLIRWTDDSPETSSAPEGVDT